MAGMLDIDQAALAADATGSFDRLVRFVAEEVRRSLDAHQSSVSLTIPGCSGPVVKASSLSEKYAAWRDYDAPPDGSGIYSLVIESNRPQRLTQEELERHPRFRHFGAERERHPPLRGWLAVPIVSPSGRNLGLIQLSDKASGEFTAADEAAAQHFANLLAPAVALQAAREELEQRVARRTHEVVQLQLFYEAIFNGLRKRIVVLDAGGAILAANDAWRQQGRPRGLSDDAIGVGVSLAEACRRLEGDHAAALAPLVAAAEGVLAGAQEEVELDVPFGADGRPGWQYARVRRFPEPSPAVAIVTLSDITQRKQTELALRESEARFERAVNGACDGIWDWDLATGDLWYNLRMREIFGHTADDPLPMHIEVFWEKLHPDDIERVRRSLETHWRDDSIYDIELRLRCADGAYRWCRGRGAALRDAAGRPYRMAGSITDIHQRKLDSERLERSLAQLEEANFQLHQQTLLLELRNAELAEAQRRAEAATRAKSEFLANMSHEIRTPMTAILGYAELLLEEDPSLGAGSRRETLRTIQRNGEHLLAILNDILDLSKIEAGMLSVWRAPCDPAGILHEVCEMMQLRAAEKGIELAIEYESPLPTTIDTDATRLRQILINLVGNAVTFTEAGGVRMVVAAEPVDGRWRLAVDVIDTGVGLSAEQQQRIFRPFTQANSSTSRQYGGTGLGLTISSRFAEMLGGGIELVASESGVGSTFRLTFDGGALDRPAPKVAPRPPAPPTISVGGQGPLLGGRRVLLAEDGVDNQRLIALLLRRLGAEVTLVANGREAVDAALAADTPPFDVLLMDMQMPELDGYEATRALRAAGYDGPIVALTALAMAEDRGRCLAAGCDEYLTKPIDRGALAATLGRIVAQRDLLAVT